jgi:hypothetical protein
VKVVTDGDASAAEHPHAVEMAVIADHEIPAKHKSIRTNSGAA